MKIEHRDALAPELRFAEADSDAGTFSGYASIFGEPDSYGDTIRPGAFRKSLTENRSIGGPSMFWDHNRSEPIGVWTDLQEDARGLRATGRIITDTTRGADVWRLMKGKAVNGLSIGFRAKASQRAAGGGRILSEIDLVEISVVTLPGRSNARITDVRAAGTPDGAAFIEAVRRAARSIRGF